MATIAVVNAPYAGHVIPATRLGAVLAGRGHRVIGWAAERYLPVVEAAGLESRCLSSTISPRVGASWRDVEIELAAMTVEVTGPLVEQMLDDDVALVVHDVTAPWGRVAAQWHGVPSIVSCPLYVTPEQTPGVMGTGGPAGASLEASVRTIRDAWGVELGSPLRNPGDLTLLHTTPEILGAGGDDPLLRFVGALPDSPERGVSVPFEADQRPLVLMTLGTFFNEMPLLFQAVIDALEHEPLRLVIATGGGVLRAELEPVPANVIVVDRFTPAPWQRAVLRQAAAFVTHCGTGTAHDALLAGVPMVCMPFGGDQPAMARRVAELGAGLQLETYDAEAIRAAVLRLLEDPGPRSRARELGDSLRRHDGPAVAAEAVAEILD